MYQMPQRGSSWLKHLDFAILDLIVLQLAFVLSYMLRHGARNPYALPQYAAMAVFLTACDLIILIFAEPFRGVMKRGYYREAKAVFQQAVLLELFAVLFLFSSKTGEDYSRISMFLMAALYCILGYLGRLGLKRILRRARRDEVPSLLIITTRDAAPSILSDIRSTSPDSYRLAGLILTDGDPDERSAGGIPIVAPIADALDYVQKNWVDEVFLSLKTTDAFPQALVDEIVEMGITVHLNMAQLSQVPGVTHQVKRLGTAGVLTTSLGSATTGQVFFKRALDIVGGLVGCVLTAILFLFVAPAIYRESPGPIFFRQERVGKNGKRFLMYKFRSMYPDAEERKKELLAQNKMGSELMFKLDFDPRIIGNRILPDGTRKTGIGQFIRSTSIDEFPQFWNVLKGDMSLVGTRPPLVSEFKAYAPHHRIRMSVKPGITGLWQISGRSEITDFEEVVKLDTQYISNWTPGLDIKILLQTVITVLKRKGSV